MKRIAPVVIALAILVLAFVLGRGPRADDGLTREVGESRSARADTLVAPAPEESAPVAEVERREASTPESEAPAPSESGGGATLVVRAVWDDDGSPAECIGVAVADVSRPDPYLYQARSVTDALGTATFELAAPCELRVRLDQGDYDQVSLAPGEERVLEIEAKRWAVVEGLVVDQGGNPVADAEIWVSAGSNYTDGSVVARTRPDGRFQVPVGEYQYIGARKPGHVPSHLRSPRPGKGKHVELVLRLRGPCGRIVGTVNSTLYGPIEGAQVHVGTLRGAVVELEDGGTGTQAPGFRARTDASGRFSVDMVEPGRSSVYARAPGYALVGEVVEVEVGKETEVAFVLERGVTVRGVVRDTEGHPVDKAWIGSGAHGRFDAGHTYSDADGSFELGGGPARDWELVARREVGEATRSVNGDPGSVVVWNPVLDPGLSIYGSVIDSNGVPLEGVRVLASVPLGRTRQATTAANGSFRLTNAPDVDHDVRVVRDRFPLFEARGIRPSDSPLAITIEAERLQEARILGRVASLAGTPVSLTLWQVNGNLGLNLDVDEAGTFEQAALPPGTYRVWVSGDHYPRAVLATFELAAGEIRDLGVLEVRAVGALRVSAASTGKEPEGGYFVRVDERDGEYVDYGNTVEGEADFDLAPGTYLVRAGHGSGTAAHALVDVRSGETTELELALRATPCLEIRFDFGGQVPASLTLEVRDEAGWVVERSQLAEFGEELVSRAPLPAGTYRVAVSCSDGREAQETATVTSVDTVLLRPR